MTTSSGQRGSSNQEGRPATSPPTIPTTPAHWFFRGGVVGILFCAALNSLSYFVRSDGWGNLIGTAPDRSESLGFPFQIWEAGNSYGGFYADYAALGLNVLCALVVASACGAVTVANRDLLTRMVHDFENRLPPRASARAQFSIRGLLLLSTICAIIAALARIAARPEFLAATFVVGPWLLVAVALSPRRISWPRRVWILAVCAIALIGGAIAIGAALTNPVAFDRVLFGIFVCWTPQSALAAIGLTLAIVLHYHRTNAVSGAKQHEIRE